MREPNSEDPPQAEPEGISQVTRRIQNVLVGVELDRASRERLDDALNRFAELEAGRARLRGLANARHQRQRIASILDLLAELEDLTVNEVDASVFTELALLFDDVVSSARSGAAAMRELAGR